MLPRGLGFVPCRCCVQVFFLKLCWLLTWEVPIEVCSMLRVLHWQRSCGQQNKTKQKSTCPHTTYCSVWFVTKQKAKSGLDHDPPMFRLSLTNSCICTAGDIETHSVGGNRNRHGNLLNQFCFVTRKILTWNGILDADLSRSLLSPFLWSWELVFSAHWA